MDSNKVFGQGGKVGESDKLNIDSIIARLLEGNTLLSLRLSSRMDFYSCTSFTCYLV